MQNSQILSASLQQGPPFAASLFSEDRTQSIAVTVLGYQFPDSSGSHDANWYRLVIEYHRRSLKLEIRTCDFDAASFRNCLEALARFRGYEPGPRTILTPPYGSEISILVFSRTPPLLRPRARGRRKIVLPPFGRPLSGLFIQATLSGLPIQFKTSRRELKRFADDIAAIASALPSRYSPKSCELNPVKTLEARFHGLEVSDGVVNWFTHWIEEDIKHREQPLFRCVARHERRLAGKPRALTADNREKLVGYVKQVCRSKAIASWR
jgi:hypothetical protein